jgi:hypothetical protein
MRQGQSRVVEYATFVATFSLFLGTTARARAQDPPISGYTVTLRDGKRKFLITNHSLSPVTAYIITGEHVRGQQITYKDSVINAPVLPPLKPGESRMVNDLPDLRPLMPGETRTETIGGVMRGGVMTWNEEQLRAALFKDGTTFGDDGWVQLIVAIRRGYYNNLVIAIGMLEEAQQAGATGDDLKQQFDKMYADQRYEATHGSHVEFGGHFAKLYPLSAIDLVRHRLEGRGGSPETLTPLGELLPDLLYELKARRELLLESKPGILEEPEN